MEGQRGGPSSKFTGNDEFLRVPHHGPCGLLTPCEETIQPNDLSASALPVLS